MELEKEFWGPKETKANSDSIEFRFLYQKIDLKSNNNNLRVPKQHSHFILCMCLHMILAY